MTEQDLLNALSFYFPGTFGTSSRFLNSDDGRIVVERLLKMPTDPVTHTQFNQLLHIARERGVSAGFFKYYFLSPPHGHPYAIDRLFDSDPGFDESGLSSFEQIRWGCHRFFVDGLLYFDRLRDAFLELAPKSYDELEQFFARKCFNSEEMRARGPALQFAPIAPEDRYLISEVACKAYSPVTDGDSVLLIEETLLRAYRARGGGRLLVKRLFDSESQIADEDPNAQMMLEFTAEEFADDTVDTEEELRHKIGQVAKRFVQASSPW